MTVYLYGKYKDIGTTGFPVNRKREFSVTELREDKKKTATTNEENGNI